MATHSNAQANQPAPETAPDQANAERLFQLGTGFMVTAALHAALKLGIADLLRDGPQPVAALANATSTNEDALYRTLRAVASIGVFEERSPRRFAQTPMSELLVADHPGAARGKLMWLTHPLHFDTYSEFLYSVKTGETVCKRVYGVPIFEYFQKNKETSEIFNAAMTSFSRDVIDPVLQAYDFSWLDGGTLADIAGGHGAILAAILEKYPKIRGKLFDLEHVLEGARPRFATGPLAGRCEFISGDFFKEVPAADAYVMKHIIHDWDDEKSVQILRNCRRAGSQNARVILFEAVIQPGNEPHPAKWLDLEMLLLPGGKERTEAEFASLFERAGFRIERVVPSKSLVWVVEAVKAG